MVFTHLFLLALIQGVTEFLPISSSGHLNLLHVLSGFPPHSLLLDVALHSGTLLAVITYFRLEVAQLLTGITDLLAMRYTANRLFALQLLLASLPVIIIGGILVLSDNIEFLRSPTIIAWATLLFALPLWMADRFCSNFRPLSQTGAKGAIFIGFMQVLSLIPGASRAGVTLMAGRMLGCKRIDAARFSILLSIPTIGLLTLAGLIELIEKGELTQANDAFWAMALSAIIGFITIRIFLSWVSRFTLTPFILYRILLGTALLLLAW